MLKGYFQRRPYLLAADKGDQPCAPAPQIKRDASGERPPRSRSSTTRRRRKRIFTARSCRGSCNQFLRAVAHLADCIGKLFQFRDAGPNCFGQARSAFLEIAAGDLALLVDCESVAVRERHLYQLSTSARLVWQLKLRR